MKKIILLLLLSPAGLFAQEQAPPAQPPAKTAVGYYSGQFMFSTDFGSVFFNLVGTGIRYTKGKTSVAWSVFPTLRFHQDTAVEEKRPFLTAGFATGPVFQYGRLVVGCPAFYDGHELRWHYTFGVGMKIGR